MAVKPLFTLENATFCHLAPQPFILWVWDIGSCVLSSPRAAKWPPYELILSISKFPYIRYIRLYGVYTVIYGIYTVYGNPIYGLGQPHIYIYIYIYIHGQIRCISALVPNIPYIWCPPHLISGANNTLNITVYIRYFGQKNTEYTYTVWYGAYIHIYRVGQNQTFIGIYAV
jgi:hypothetical protein